jgi:hypothetical protein
LRVRMIRDLLPPKLGKGATQKDCTHQVGQCERMIPQAADT